MNTKTLSRRFTRTVSASTVSSYSALIRTTERSSPALWHLLEKNRIETAQFDFLTPYPGTAFGKAIDEHGRLETKDWSRDKFMALYSRPDRCPERPSKKVMTGPGASSTAYRPSGGGSNTAGAILGRSGWQTLPTFAPAGTGNPGQISVARRQPQPKAAKSRGLGRPRESCEAGARTERNEPPCRSLSYSLISVV